MRPQILPYKKTKMREDNINNFSGEYFDESTKAFLAAQKESFNRANNRAFFHELTYVPANSIGLNDPTLYNDNARQIVGEAYSNFNRELLGHQRQGDLTEKTAVNMDLIRLLNKSNENFRKKNMEIIEKKRKGEIKTQENMMDELKKLRSDVKTTYTPILSRYSKLPTMYRVRRNEFEIF